MFFEALIIGGATFYLWMLAAQLHTPIIYPIQKWLRLSWRRPLIGCPYCFGFWGAVALTLLVQWGRLDWVMTPLTILAAAALSGFVGSFTPGIDDEEEILEEG